MATEEETSLAGLLQLTQRKPEDGLHSPEDQEIIRRFQRNPTWNRIQDVLIGVFQAQCLTDIARYASQHEKVMAAAGGLAIIQRLLREMPHRMLEYERHRKRGDVPTVKNATSAESMVRNPALYEE